MDPDFAAWSEFKNQNIVWIEENARGMDYRNEHRELRTWKVHTCGICGTKTNRWAVMHFMGYPSIRLNCPYRNDGGQGCNEINLKHMKLQAFQERLYDDDGLTPREIEEIRVEIQILRKYFSMLPGDVIEP
jgi:hypothetical protein